MKRSTATAGAVLTAVSALGFSTLPVFGVIAYRAGANVVTVLAIRFVIAAIFLWGYLLLTRTPLPDRRTGLQLLFLGGVGYTTMSALYLSAVAADRLSPSLAALVLYTYPAVVALEARLAERRPFSGRQATALPLTLAGVALVLLTPGAGSHFTPIGAALALGAAVVYATYIYFGSRVTRRTSPLAATTYVTTAAAAVFGGYGLGTSTLVPVALTGWLAIAGMAVFATVLAVLLFFAGIERLGPARASIISTLEPVGTVLLATVFFHDRLGPWQVGGGLLVLAGVLWLQTGRSA